MNIRKYMFFSILFLIFLGLMIIIAYRQYYSVVVGHDLPVMEMQDDISRRARVSEGGIQIIVNGKWEDFEIRGIQLSSFKPGYIRNRSSVPKEDVIEWLEAIALLGVNTIQIPYLQPPAFYDAIFEFNLSHKEPLYIIHSVPIDGEAAMVFYNAYQPEVVDNIRADMRNTVDALHGRAAILDNQRHHAGLYLKDVSAYVIGYIIGDQTSAGVVTLTNQRFATTRDYTGTYYAVQDVTPFECFVAENLDYICNYEIENYGTLSLYSYLSSPETDPVEHRNESNASRGAGFDLDNIRYLKPDMQNLIACYSVHPNSPVFMDYDLVDNPERRNPDEPSAYQIYLERLVEHHDLPVFVTGVGIPASRGVSHIDLDDGYDRGGHNEEKQGELLVNLLEDIKGVGCRGVVIQSFQDEWLLHSTHNTKEFDDPESAYSWQDVQSSDKCFGLLEFIPGENAPVCVVDGDASEWVDAPLYESNGIRFTVNSDNTYLYLMAEIPDFSLRDDTLSIALDVTPKSGASRWEEQNLDLPFPADFIVNLHGYNESRIVVQSRYNLFRYRFAYYSHIQARQTEVPAADEPVFSAIYQINRYNVILQDTNQPLPIIYHETGQLIHGTANVDDTEYNSLTDFCKDQVLEVRIPWSLINVRDPVRRAIQPDFFMEGIGDEIRIRNIRIGFVYRPQDGDQVSSGALSYNLPNLSNTKYHSRLRTSAYILKEYWNRNKKQEAS